MAQALESRLRAGLATLHLDLADQQVVRLIGYLQLIIKWNKVYNLTALRDPAQMLTHHLLDSLAIVNPFRGQVQARQGTLLDVGSGAGLPGVAVAICCPQVQVDCVDAVAKKAAFVQQAAVELGLLNLRGVHGRVQDLASRYEVVTCRAFASLVDFVAWSDAALASDGVWLAMKGKLPTGEIAKLPCTVDVFHVEQLEVPDLNAERCIVWMRRRAA